MLPPLIFQACASLDPKNASLDPTGMKHKERHNLHSGQSRNTTFSVVKAALGSSAPWIHFRGRERDPENLPKSFTLCPQIIHLYGDNRESWWGAKSRLFCLLEALHQALDVVPVTKLKLTENKVHVSLYQSHLNYVHSFQLIRAMQVPSADRSCHLITFCCWGFFFFSHHEIKKLFVIGLQASNVSTSIDPSLLYTSLQPCPPKKLICFSSTNLLLQ